jgi:hypothetical protein
LVLRAVLQAHDVVLGIFPASGGLGSHVIKGRDIKGGDAILQQIAHKFRARRSGRKPGQRRGPSALLIATMTALAWASVMQLSGRALHARTSLSFGPFLAGGLILTVGFQ